METFVVRVWTSSEPPDGVQPTLRGLVEHTGSRARAPFQGAQELIEFVRTALAEARRDRLFSASGDGEVS